jgi:hypothetical protein
MTAEEWVRKRLPDVYFFGAPAIGWHVFTKSGVDSVRLAGPKRRKSWAWAEAKRNLKRMLSE